MCAAPFIVVAPRECLLCGRFESTELQVFNNEAAAGAWHAACPHDACRPCLEAYVESKLPGCEAQGQLAVPCFAPECRKRLPQRLVLEVSARAACLAHGLDCGGGRCSRCSQFARLYRPAGCAHSACELCWGEVPTLQQCRLELQCWHPECTVTVEADFWRMLRVQGVVPHAVRNSPVELDRLGTLAWRAGPADAPGPVCPVCREHCVALLPCCQEPGSCGHAACEGCWLRWAELQLDRCVQARSVVARCIGPECREIIGEQLWAHLVGRSAALSALAAALRKRARLQASALFPAAAQVDCPRWGCVGLGYLGYETVMCFLCEHQWSPEEGGAAVPDVDAEVVMGVAVKRCPKCHECIEKNGGCDHMTCRCRYEFWWSTLQPFKPGG